MRVVILSGSPRDSGWVDQIAGVLDRLANVTAPQAPQGAAPFPRDGEARPRPLAEPGPSGNGAPAASAP